MKKFPVRGFTLVETLIAAAILVFCLCGLLAAYINMFLLTDLARDFTLATNAMQAEMEDIKRTSFDSLMALNGTPFDVNGFAASDAKGRIEVCDNTSCPALISYGDLKRVRLVVCFRSRGRVIGEDANFNGALDVGLGEDINNNSRLDSPAELITLIAR
jgi:prepilin-type N-terminal cleavage/methylation domain-containing protein